MALGRLHIVGAAKVTKLTGGTLGPTGLSFTIDDPSGWPTGGVNGKFPITINPGQAGEEHLWGQSRTGSTIDVAAVGDRGVDGTPAGTHAIDSVVQIGWFGAMADEANQHVNDTSVDHHTQYMMANGTRHDTTSRHPVGSVVPAGNPGAFAIADSMAQGAATTAARSDHRHAGPGWGAAPPSIAQSAAAGAALTPARSDHTHDLGAGIIDEIGLFGGGLQPIFVQASAPVQAANRIWFDTTNRILKIRDAANTAWQHWMRWDWRSYTPTITGFNLGTGTKYGYYLRLGTLVVAEFGFVIGSGASSTGAVLAVSLPVGATNPGFTEFNWVGAGRAFQAADGRFASIGIINTATDTGNIQSFATAGQSPWKNDAPFSPWNNGAVFNGLAVYEAALETG